MKFLALVVWVMFLVVSGNPAIAQTTGIMAAPASSPSTPSGSPNGDDALPPEDKILMQTIINTYPYITPSIPPADQDMEIIQDLSKYIYCYDLFPEYLSQNQPVPNSILDYCGEIWITLF